MVLSSRSRCMVLTMVGQFDHLLPTLRLICGVLGRKSIPWLPVLPSQKVVRKRLVLDQIPIFWKVKCSEEREEMDSHLEIFWSFYLSSLFQLSWVEVWVLSPFSFSFFASLPIVFLKGRWPILHEDKVVGMEHFLDRPFEMDRLTVGIFCFVVREIVWQRWISILGVGNWHARHLRLLKQWYAKEKDW